MTQKMTRRETMREYPGWRTDLIREALAAQKNGYCPYSHFKVGAAILLRDGRIFDGCNVENAAYGSTICAERGAIMHAFAHGAKPGDFIAVAFVTDAPDPVSSCGACRQALAEFSPVADPMIVYCCSKGGEKIFETTLADDLPRQFPSPDAAEMIGRNDH